MSQECQNNLYWIIKTIKILYKQTSMGLKPHVSKFANEFKQQAAEARNLQDL